MKTKIKISDVYKLAFPAIVSNATVMFVSMIDLAFISRFGNATIAIAATAIANNICAAIYYFLEGLRSGTTVLISRFSGEENKKNIAKIINIAIFSAIVSGIVVAILSPVISKAAYKMLGNKEIGAIGQPYIQIRLLGLPFHLVVFAIMGFFLGIKNTVVPFIITITICSLNVFFNYLFGYNLIGLNLKSSNGIALATATSYVIGLAFSILLLTHLKISKFYIDLKESFKSVKKSFLKICFEIGFYSGLLVIALTLFVAIFASLGPSLFAAHQIVFQVFMATYLPLMGFFVATTILISKIIGEKREKDIKRAATEIWLYSLPLILIVLLFVFMFTPEIAHFFSPQDDKVAKLAINSIYLVCATQILSSIYLVVKGSLTAMKDTRFLLIAGTITSFFFFLPLTYLLVKKMNFGVFGGYTAFTLWTALDVSIFSLRFLSLKGSNS